MASTDASAEGSAVSALETVLKSGRFGAAGAEAALSIEERRLLGIAEVALVPAKGVRRRALL